jgi:radical SAM protein with 4Fe4S-binding SPASM domain
MLDCDTFRIGELNQPLARGLGSAKTRRILDASLAEQLACDYCAFKPFCGVCPVLAYADDGELTGNVLAHRRCEIYGGMLRYILRSFASSKDAQQAFAKILEEADW